MTDFISIFDTEYGPKLASRLPTFRAVVREALARNVKYVVETGCARLQDNWAGDGQSTIIWDRYAKFSYHEATFVTVDIDEKALQLASEMCPGLVHYCMDSVKYLQGRAQTIDLLYLDSFDVDMAKPHDAAMHGLYELCAAMPRLHSGSIVFVDDSPISSNFEIGGKGKYIALYFRQLGILPFTFGYQAAWLIP